MFDWIASLVDGIGNAISTALSAAWESVSSGIWETFMRWLYSMAYSAAADTFSMMTDMGAELYDLNWVNAALRFFSLFGWGLFIAGMVVAIFDIAIEYQSQGRMNVKRQILPFLWGLLAVNLFTTVPVALFRFSVSLQNTFAKDLSAVLAGEDVTIGGTAEAALKFLHGTYDPGTNALISLLSLICLAYCVIKCFFSNIKRGGILLTQIAVGSFHLFSLPRGYSDGFVGWCKQIIAICFTTFMQTTLLFMGLLTLKEYPILGLGVMLAANEVPRIAQQFGLETGTKPQLMSVVHTTTSAINLTRMIAKK